jgi:hypothetical protein
LRGQSLQKQTKEDAEPKPEAQDKDKAKDSKPTKTFYSSKCVRDVFGKPRVSAPTKKPNGLHITIADDPPVDLDIIEKRKKLLQKVSSSSSPNKEMNLNLGSNPFYGIHDRRPTPKTKPQTKIEKGLTIDIEPCLELQGSVQDTTIARSTKVISPVKLNTKKDVYSTFKASNLAILTKGKNPKKSYGPNQSNTYKWGSAKCRSRCETTSPKFLQNFPQDLTGKTCEPFSGPIPPTTGSKSPHQLISHIETPDNTNQFAQKLMFFGQEDQDAYKSCGSLDIKIDDWLPPDPNNQGSNPKTKPANGISKFFVEEKSVSSSQFKLEKIPEALRSDRKIEQRSSRRLIGVSERS